MEKQAYCYIMASRKNGTIYIGVTSDLLKRAYEHKIGFTEGFSAKYDCKSLVWYQAYPTMPDAIQKEKQLKKWQRNWKLRLIESRNPAWVDLYPGLLGDNVILDSRLRGNDGNRLTLNSISTEGTVDYRLRGNDAVKIRNNGTPVGNAQMLVKNVPMHGRGLQHDNLPKSNENLR